MMPTLSAASPTFDFLALGESVVDFISIDRVAHLEEAAHFERFVGGQAANLAMNMARLGNRAAIGTCVGADGFGMLLRQQIAAAGVSTDYIQITTEAPTTLIPVTRTTNGTPKFIVYRGADVQLALTDALLAVASQSKIVHTSAFALSREPARSTILRTMQIARENGHQVSLDPNYHPCVWPDSSNFMRMLQDAYQFVNITKPSLDDCARLFGSGLAPDEYAGRFLRWGAELVAISMGTEGVYLATKDAENYQIIPNQISAVDVTGAGDAFWSGFLTALLDGRSPLDSVRVGQVMAEIKIGMVGPLSNILDREAIFAKAQLIQYQAHF